MKSLSIKKYLIFSIILIYGIFGIGLLSAKALTTENGEFPDLPNDNNDSFIIVERLNGGYFLFTYNISSNLDIVYYPSSVTSDGNSMLSFGNSFSTVDYKVYFIENGSWKYRTDKDIYSWNFKELICTSNSLSAHVLGEGIVPNYIPSGYGLKKPGINLTKGSACDLDGNDKYVITADFSEIVDTDLIFQVKIGDNDWLDITEHINDHETYGYKYQYSTYWNTEFKARALYSDGTVKTESSISVTELGEFGMNITYGPACDDQGRNINVITVDLSHCWNQTWKYLYSYDNVTWYNANATGPQFTINHGIQTFLYFKILDENLNQIYYLPYEQIFDGLVKNVHVKEDVEITENGEKKIKLYVIFNEYSQFSDLYKNLRFYIGTRELAGSTGSYIYEINKDNFNDFQEIEIKVYIDNFLVDSSCYSPSYGGVDFDQKFDQIQNDKLNEELGDSDFSSVEGMINAVKNFLNAIRNFVVLFFQWIMRFFNRLNIWIRTTIIGLFVIMVICRIIKAVRR